MKYGKLIFLFCCLVAVLLLAATLFVHETAPAEEEIAPSPAIEENSPAEIVVDDWEAKTITDPVSKPETKEETAPEKKIIVQNAPFTSQSPLANWEDSRQQDACEEASALMAVYWVSGKKIGNKEEAQAAILEIAEWELKNYGYYEDTSAEDTAGRILKGYFGYDKYEIRDAASPDDLIDEIKKGNILIVPADGRLLKNPYFTGAGPERHNLVIRGFDSGTGEFITNDPGTRRGENYRYDKNLLFAALRDYPSGKHLAISADSGKKMIIIKK